MKVFIIVGQSKAFENISARAAYSTREQAEAHIVDPTRMWFDDHAVVVELELDKEVVEPSAADDLAYKELHGMWPAH